MRARPRRPAPRSRAGRACGDWRRTGAPRYRVRAPRAGLPTEAAPPCRSRTSASGSTIHARVPFVLQVLDRAMALVDRIRAARRDPPRRARLERFGAIVQLVVPRALVFVDR